MNPSTSTALRVTLVLSLALNLFVAGAFAANLWRHDGWHGKRGWHQSRGMDPRALREVLPEADQPLLKEAMPEHREQIHERLRAVHEARAQVAAALRAEPFDKDKLAAAFDLVRKREAAVAEAAQGTLVEIAGQVSPEGREAMAKQMLRRKHRGPGDRFDDRDPERGPPPSSMPDR